MKAERSMNVSQNIGISVLPDHSSQLLGATSISKQQFEDLSVVPDPANLRAVMEISSCKQKGLGGHFFYGTGREGSARAGMRLKSELRHRQQWFQQSCRYCCTLQTF